jgi:D-3-phosphoglycerate dehydrogenase
MPVLAYARSLTEEGAEAAGVTRAMSLEQLFRGSDIVSLHLPLTADTRGLVRRELVALMPKGALLINTARAEVVDNEALLKAAREGRIRIGTDVYAAEPEGGKGEFQDPLGAEPGVYGTHHIGASTAEAQSAIAAETVHIVRHFIEHGEVISPVNVLLRPPHVGTLVVRHLDKVGVLASVLSALKAANINVENMENVIFSGGKAACARIRVADWPSDAVLAELGRLENVLHAEIV